MGARFFHAGLWLQPEDLTRALLFFETLLGFQIVSRSPRKTGGERIFLRTHKKEYLELLVSDTVKPQPEMGLHPKDRVSGIPHLSFIVNNLPALRDQFVQSGFNILMQIPPALSGFVKSETGEHRIIFVEGPGHFSVEIFEFKHYTLD